VSASKTDKAQAWMELASKLRQARQDAGLSQAEVAGRAGLSRVSVSEIESGRRKVSSLELASLAKLYDRGAEHFLGTSNAEPSFGSPTMVSHLARTAKQLAPQDQEQLVRFAEYLRGQSRKKSGAH
jgi:transcriptional regulator with XRE-family HTH domain